MQRRVKQLIAPLGSGTMTEEQKHETIDALITKFGTTFPREFATIVDSMPNPETIADANARGDAVIDALGSKDGGDRVKSLAEFDTVREWITLSYGTSRTLYG